MTQANIIKVGDLAPGANLDAYKQTVNSFAILTAEEERGLAEQLYYQQDLESARRLVMSHLRFVIHIARSYSGYGLAQSDLIQEGNVGLMKAVRRFNPEVGVRLVSFAVHWIKAEIHEYVLRNWRIVKVATTKAQRKLFFNLRSAKKNLNWFNANEVEAVAADLGVKPETVRQMEGRLSAHDMSFDLPVNDDEPAWGAPAHYLEDSASDPADIVESQDFERNAQEQFSAALADLDPRSRDILGQRWLTDKKATLHQLAAQYGVSAERIRQLEKNAINKLKAVIQA